jgi:hypothetical protein
MLDLAHGLSERPDASYTLEWHSRLVGGWLEALGPEDVDPAGTRPSRSFGVTATPLSP